MKQRKPSTPDNKNKSRRNRLNLFGKSDSAYNYNETAQNYETEGQKDTQMAIYDNTGRSNKKDHYANEFSKHWRDVDEEEEEDNETQAASELEEEVAITIMIKEEPKVTVSLNLLLKFF